MRGRHRISPSLPDDAVPGEEERKTPPPESAPGTARVLPLVRLDCVNFGFARTPVFTGLSLELFAGEHLALLGANGTGKSTFLRLIQGELRPDQDGGGRILWGFGGKEESSALAAREHVRLVSAARQSVYVRRGWKISGEELLLSGLENEAMLYSRASSADSAQAAALAGAAGAAYLLDLPVPAMSQGQLRLALILRALISNPALLLLDEPFESLDARARRQVADGIALAAKRGSTLLVSAHRGGDVPDGLAAALVLQAGRLRRCRLDDARAVALLAPGLSEAADLSDPPAGPPAAALSPSPDGIPSGGDKAPPFAESAVPLLELVHVDVFIERRKVLSDITFTVRPGERWLVSGRNGAGKSTLLRLLYGEEFAAYGGKLLWRGGPRPALENLRAAVGYVSDRLQDVYDYDLSAEDIVISGLRGSIGLYREPSPGERALARDWLERLSLSSIGASPFHTLSSGLARRALLARALAGEPSLLLLDEPCSGLDAESRAHFLRLLRDLALRGSTLICASPHNTDMDGLFTHELRLEAGKTVFCRQTAQFPFQGKNAP